MRGTGLGSEPLEIAGITYEHICGLLGDKRVSSRAKREQFSFVGVDSNLVGGVSFPFLEVYKQALISGPVSPKSLKSSMLG